MRSMTPDIRQFDRQLRELNRLYDAAVGDREAIRAICIKQHEVTILRSEAVRLYRSAQLNRMAPDDTEHNVAVIRDRATIDPTRLAVRKVMK